MLGADPTKVSLRAKKRGLPQVRLCPTHHAHLTRVLTVLLNMRLTPLKASSSCAAIRYSVRIQGHVSLLLPIASANVSRSNNGEQNAVLN